MPMETHTHARYGRLRTTARPPHHDQVAARPSIADAMSWPAVAVSPDDQVANAIAHMDRGAFDHLLVIDDDYVATICRYDVWRTTGTATVGTIAREARRLSPGRDLLTAARMLRLTDACCLAVVVPGRAFGIVTARDISRIWPHAIERCDSCGGHHRVCGPSAQFCVECAETMYADPIDELYVDLGVGD